MADNSRIKVAKDKSELVKSLIVSSDTTGPFQTYADVLVFAAALGAKHNKRVPLKEISKREPAPIGQEHFLIKGYDRVINLLAVADTKDVKVLSSGDPAYDDKRIHIFEEYANGGLEILHEELRGAADYSDRLLLIISFAKDTIKQQEDEFDLSKFLH